MLFVFLGNLIAGGVLGLRLRCLALVPVALAELALLATTEASRLETALLMVAAVAALQIGYLASTFGPLIWSRPLADAPAGRRSASARQAVAAHGTLPISVDLAASPGHPAALRSHPSQDPHLPCGTSRLSSAS